MAKLLIGTSGWAYASWKPDFYPAKLPASRFLQHYASQLTSVEVNYTFRALLSAKMAQRWLEQTSAEFSFSVKAHQRFTHIKRLQPDPEFCTRFFGCLQPLYEAGRLGVVLFQLPPFLKCDRELLKTFLASLPRSYRATFEFRHPSWFSEAVYDVLRDHGAALCIAESDELETPDVLTAPFSYFRLRKAEYSAARRRQLAERFRALKEQGHDVYAYFKHEETPEGAVCAREVLAAAQ